MTQEKSDTVLQGTSVLVTRSSDQSAGMADLIRRRGGTPLNAPTIEIVEPASHEDANRAIASLYMYDGVIFTSANGVEFFMKRLREAGESAAALASKLIYVVGEKTAQAVTGHGLKVTLMPEKFTSAELAKRIDQLDLTGKAFLFPRGNLGRDILQDTLKLLGATVDSLVVYETRKPAGEQLSKMRAAVLSGGVGVLTFTSPSTFHNFAELFSKEELTTIFDRALVAAIGPVTAKAIEEAGFEADCVPPASTVEALVDAICRMVEARRAGEAGRTTTNEGEQ